MIECEHIVVRAFLTSHEVCSFRAAKLPEEFYAAKAEMEIKATSALGSEYSRPATMGHAMRGEFVSGLNGNFRAWNRVPRGYVLPSRCGEETRLQERMFGTCVERLFQLGKRKKTNLSRVVLSQCVMFR